MGNNRYFNEHKMMKMRKDMGVVAGLDYNDFNVFSYGDYVLITRLRNIKGLNYIYTKRDIIETIEIKVSSVTDEIYLDSFIKFDRIEENIPVFYNVTGIIIEKDIIDDILDEDIMINIISNYCDIILK